MKLKDGSFLREIYPCRLELEEYLKKAILAPTIWIVAMLVNSMLVRRLKLHMTYTSSVYHDVDFKRNAYPVMSSHSAIGFQRGYAYGLASLPVLHKPYDAS